MLHAFGIAMLPRGVMESKKYWMFDRRKFVGRYTLVLGVAMTGFMALTVETLDAGAWVFLAAVGFLFAYIWSVIMWRIFVSPRAQSFTSPDKKRRH